MNKQFFAILVLALVGQMYGMDNEEIAAIYRPYPKTYPHAVATSRIWTSLRGQHLSSLEGATDRVRISQEEEQILEQFENGNGLLVIALKALNSRQAEELATLKRIIEPQSTELAMRLGKVYNVDTGALIPQDNNNPHWRALTERLANPPADQIARWEAILKEFPTLWGAHEKGALTANLFSIKKPEYFTNLLLFCIAKYLDAVFYRTLTFYRIKLDEKDAIIAHERNAQANAEGRVAAAAAAQRAALANELRGLEPNKDAVLRTLRHKIGEVVYADHQQLIPLEAGTIQMLADRRVNPPADQMQSHTTNLLIADLNPLFELLIKKAQADPQNAKALSVSAMANVQFAMSDVYLQLIRKLQADVTRLTQENTDLTRNYAATIAKTEQQAKQIDQRTARAFQEFAREVSPLRRELPVLRDRVREQDIEIQALRNALAPRNQQ